VKYFKSDLFSLIFELEKIIIHIHNMYLLSSKFLWDINKKFLIYYLWNLLNKFSEHFLIKNFNVYYSIWKEARYTHWHDMMNNLIQIASKMNLFFLIFSDIIIRKLRNQKSIINLIFVTTEITYKLASCMIN